MSTPKFKPYNQLQATFLPPSLDELIPSGHPVRVVNSIVDKIDLKPLIDSYSKEGASCYHPEMLLKVLLYAYLRNIYSTRRMEESLQENIHFMWLAAGNRPDHNTLSRFRSNRLEPHVEFIFSQTVHLLVEAGLVSLKEAFVDGTKIEANANKYTFVWGKAITYHKKKIQRQLDELITYARGVNTSEAKIKSVVFEELSSDKVQQTIDQINDHLKQKDVDPKVKQKLRYARKNWPSALDRYSQQEEKLGKRNSYSKTDPDATFMRMKDDHMMNGQLKPGYNLQVSTENQFVTNVTIHSDVTDYNTLEKHLESYKDKHQCLPDNLTADAGYGNNENYSYLQKNKISGYVKYPGLHREEKTKKTNFHPDSWEYNRKENTFMCPAGRTLTHVSKSKRKTANGYKQSLDKYECISCKGCEYRNECYNGKTKKTITVNHQLRSQKKKAKKLLYSTEGINRRKRRCWEVETFFGDIKQNRMFKRFNLRGMKNVLVESCILAMTYNIRKVPA